MQPGATASTATTPPAPTVPVKAPAKPSDPEPSPSAEPRGRLAGVGAYAQAGRRESARPAFAMLGYEAKIESADVPDKGTVHRVRVGPYRDPDEAGKVRGDLARQGIEVTVVKP